VEKRALDVISWKKNPLMRRSWRCDQVIVSSVWSSTETLPSAKPEPWPKTGRQAYAGMARPQAICRPCQANVCLPPSCLGGPTGRLQGGGDGPLAAAPWPIERLPQLGPSPAPESCEREVKGNCREHAGGTESATVPGLERVQ